MHRTARELIRPGLSHALGAWQRNVNQSIQAEHSSIGLHTALRHPKAAIWLGRIDREAVQPGSVILGEPVRLGENFEYVFRGRTGDHWEGDLTFLEGFPGTMAALASSWWERADSGEIERQLKRDGDTLIVRIPNLGAVGVVIW